MSNDGQRKELQCLQLYRHIQAFVDKDNHNDDHNSVVKIKNGFLIRQLHIALISYNRIITL